MTGPYAAQRALSDLTEQQAQPARLLQGVFVIEVGWVLGAGLWFGLWSGVLSPSDTTALAAIVTLLTHGILMLVTLMVVRASQQRTFWDLLGRWDQALADFIAVMVWAGGIAVALAVISALAMAEEPDAAQKPILVWVMVLPFACAAILLQTTAEEIYFRGYIQSTLAARFSNPLIWMLLPSLFFGLLHWTAEAGPVQAVHTVIITTAFGMAAADLTARSGTLGAATALHFVYNAGLMLTSGVSGDPLSGLALYLFDADIAAAIEAGPLVSLDLLIWLLILAILWLAARNALRL